MKKTHKLAKQGSFVFTKVVCNFILYPFPCVVFVVRLSFVVLELGTAIPYYRCLFILLTGDQALDNYPLYATIGSVFHELFQLSICLTD